MKKSTDYTATYNRLNTNYIQVQKDISKNRNKQSLQAVGNYGKNALAAAAVLGGIKMGIDGINNTFDPWSQKTIP
ncbi:MAG: hypothetical protein PHR06_13670 [Candidatus Cloacimonetes bacterium]|nr:hypothetical protein [Candidatus Cloacimonadota bacterium]